MFIKVGFLNWVWAGERNRVRAETLVKNEPRQPLKTLLLVDDEDECRIMTKWFLTDFGYAVASVRSAEAALAVFDPAIHALVVTDNSMPGMSGAEMARVVKERSASTPVLMYTAMPPEDQSGLDLVIVKPAHLLTIKDAIDRLLALSAAKLHGSEVGRGRGFSPSASSSAVA